MKKIQGRAEKWRVKGKKKKKKGKKTAHGH